MAEDLKVFSTPTVRSVLQDVLPKFQQDTGHRVEVSYVGAGANMQSFGRFQNAERFAAALACSWRWRCARLQASVLGVSLSAVALALDQHGLDVVEQAVQQG